MARKAKQKLLATITPDYKPDFVGRLDGRTKLADVIPQRIESIETDLGGSDGLSYARKSLVRRAVWLEAVEFETYEQNLGKDRTIDLGAYTQAINSLLGLFRLLGLERRQKPARSLREVMNGTAVST
jgi:hypothetical protein